MAGESPPQRRAEEEGWFTIEAEQEKPLTFTEDEEVGRRSLLSSPLAGWIN